MRLVQSYSSASSGLIHDSDGKSAWLDIGLKVLGLTPGQIPNFSVFLSLYYLMSANHNNALHKPFAIIIPCV